MKKNQKRLLTLAVLMATSPAFAAMSLNELEPNNTAGTAQNITLQGGEIDVNAAISDPATSTTSTTTSTSPTAAFLPGMTGMTAPVNVNDVDFYSFYAEAGTVITLNVSGTALYTTVAVFDNNNSYKVMRTNYGGTGSVSSSVTTIDKIEIPARGYYTIGVVGYPRYFTDGGSVSGVSTAKGNYIMAMKVELPVVQQINIEVRPGSNGLGTLNPKSKGKIPVALLGDAKFNPLTVDTSTLTFGALGNENSLGNCVSSGEDVNNDGYLDLICLFENQAAGFQYGDTEGTVKGKTKNGRMFQGTGVLKVVPIQTK